MSTRVFISYHRFSEVEIRRVHRFAMRLLDEGIDVRLDEYEENRFEGGLQRWMIEQLARAEFVLMVCSKTYRDNVLGTASTDTGAGVDFEGNMILTELHKTRSRDVRFIPVVLAREDSNFIPEPLEGRPYFNVASRSRFDALCDLLIQGRYPRRARPSARHGADTDPQAALRNAKETLAEGIAQGEPVRAARSFRAALAFARKGLRNVSKKLSKHNEDRGSKLAAAGAATLNEFDSQSLFAELTVVAARAWTELARVETTATARLTARRAAVSVSRKSAERVKSPRIAIALANAVVDGHYDWVAQESWPALLHNYAVSSREITAALGVTRIANERARLYAQQTSLLLCRAQKENNSDQRRKTRRSALSAAEKAIKEDAENDAAHLARAMALEAIAVDRNHTSDDEFVGRLAEAADEYVLAAASASAMALVALARFYRRTFMPEEAISVFKRYELAEGNRRTILDQAHIVADSAVFIWSSDNGTGAARSALEYGHDLTIEAIRWGLVEARNYVNAATLERALGYSEAGAEEMLERLGKGENEKWVDTIERARRSALRDDASGLDRGFALGIGDGMVWNQLGTYAMRFADRPDLAIDWYSTALSLKGNNYVAATNLARVLTKRGGAKDLGEAKRLIGEVRRTAPRSFRWWEPIAADIERLSE